MNTTGIAEALQSWDTLWNFLIVAGSGAFGGLVHKWVSPGEDKIPWYYHMGVGVGASIAILSVVEPSNFWKLLGFGVIAGYGGRAVLDKALAQAQAKIAKAEAANAKETGKQAVQHARMLLDHCKDLALTDAAVLKSKANVVSTNLDAVEQQLNRLEEELEK